TLPNLIILILAEQQDTRDSSLGELIHSHSIFSISVNFVFVSPDGSPSLFGFAVQGRAAFIYPCSTGRNRERLPEADTEEK
ncbi:hypothetical protein, partial [Morganella morganii]|uniref:hypothetical protein n=1 Tax=Morganella morganii TaxID=582 RepID=UPI003EC717BF